MVSVPSAFADSILYAATPYNAFVFNNFTDSRSDVEGALAAGGTVNISSYSVGATLTAGQIAASFGPGQYTLVGGSDLKAANGSLAHGNAFDGGPRSDVQQPGFTLNEGILSAGGPSPIDFSTAATELRNLSALLQLQATTGGDGCTFDGYATTTCKAVAPGLNIINVTDPAILNGKGIQIQSIYTNATLVINVSGTNDILGGSGFSAFDSGKTVMLNYYQAAALQLGSSGFTASLLAPFATVTANGGNFNGNFIANNFYGHTQFNSEDMFAGSFGNNVTNLDQPVPEPSALITVAAAMAGIFGLGVRSRCGLSSRRGPALESDRLARAR